jgi:hypothetical protein
LADFPFGPPVCHFLPFSPLVWTLFPIVADSNLGSPRVSDISAPNFGSISLIISLLDLKSGVRNNTKIYTFLYLGLHSISHASGQKFSSSVAIGLAIPPLNMP